MKLIALLLLVLALMAFMARAQDLPKCEGGSCIYQCFLKETEGNCKPEDHCTCPIH